jgi:CheY-like chemotaxis protein
MSDRRELTVLVVEDEPLIAMDLQHIVESAGYRVIGLANSVEAAHRLTEREKPHLALLDINLGRTNVFELADALAVLGTPIIFVTAHSRAVLAEAHKHRPLIAKPFLPHILLAVMREMSGVPELD